MPNEKNLRVPTSEEARKIGRKGGKASGKARREKKTIQNILTALCDSKCSDIPQFKKIAAKLGLDGDKSVKELFTLVSTLNALKTAKMDDLGKMAELLGEQREKDENLESVQETLIKIKETAIEYNRNKSETE